MRLAIVYSVVIDIKFIYNQSRINHFLNDINNYLIYYFKCFKLFWTKATAQKRKKKQKLTLLICHLKLIKLKASKHVVCNIFVTGLLKKYCP